jgi:hypothetical protein
MKNSKTDSESLLFGVLCNDVTSSNVRNDLSFEESLYTLFRSYFNNEVMRRYIVVRKILQKHNKILLFNEPCTVETNFNNLSPSEILNYIYPGSSCHSTYVDKATFVDRLNSLANDHTAWFKNVHFAVVFSYLGETKHALSAAKLADNYQKYQDYATSGEACSNEEEISEAQKLVSN